MDLIRLIYSSQPFGFDQSILNSLLVEARRCNRRDDVTGALVCRHDLYLQLLEGPARKVQDTFERIGRDDRHVDVALHVSDPVAARLFGDWAMLHDPAHSLIWSPKDVEDGALERATPEEFSALFTRLASSATPSKAAPSKVTPSKVTPSSAKPSR